MGNIIYHDFGSRVPHNRSRSNNSDDTLHRDVERPFEERVEEAIRLSDEAIREFEEAIQRSEAAERELDEAMREFEEALNRGGLFWW